MKIELDQNTVDRLVGKRVAQFNKEIRALQQKLERRETQIQKLKHQVETLKGQLAAQSGEEVQCIVRVANHLVTLMQEANWVAKPTEWEEYLEEE